MHSIYFLVAVILVFQIFDEKKLWFSDRMTVSETVVY